MSALGRQRPLVIVSVQGPLWRVKRTFKLLKIEIMKVRSRAEAATHPLIVNVCFRVTRHVISILESPHVTIADQYGVEIGPDTRRQTRGIRNHQSMLASKRNGQS